MTRKSLWSLLPLLVAGAAFLAGIFSDDLRDALKPLLWPWGVVVALVVGAGTYVVLHLREERLKRKQQEKEQEDKAREETKRQVTEGFSIKELRPFGTADAGIFARLERESTIRKWVGVITAAEFRLGILYSTSGCGKTSLLRAGLLPRLAAADRRGVYVKLTDEEPLETIRRAAAEQLELPPTLLADAPTLPALLKAIGRADAPAVVVLDQFEQYFLYLRGPLATDPLAQGLREVYLHRPALAATVVISLRDDFMDRLNDLLNLGFRPLPQDSYRLEKFSPEQATAVCKVMAEQAGMVFDEEYVLRMARHELVSRDSDDTTSRSRYEPTQISPVTVQILAAMLDEQPRPDDRAFTEDAFNRLGGVDGLMEHFLEQKLSARFGQREAAVKVLLALTHLNDLNRATRTAPQTAAQLAARSKLSEADAREAADWLETARLVTTADDHPGGRAYELAHERLIAALQKKADRILTGAAQANQLLDRRVKEWLGNGRAARFLLTPSEWWRIRRHRAQLTWGEQRHEKEALLTATRRRWAWGAGLTGAIAGVGLGVLGLLQTERGIIWQTRRALYDLTAERPATDSETCRWVAQTHALDGEFTEAVTVANSITNMFVRIETLDSIAVEAIRQRDTACAAAVLQAALTSADKLTYESDKARTLANIAEAAGKLDAARAAPVLQAALTRADKITYESEKSYTLTKIAEAYSKLDAARAATVLQAALTNADKITDESDKARALASIAAAYSRVKLWKPAYETARRVSPDKRAESYYRILAAWHHRHDPPPARVPGRKEA